MLCGIVELGRRVPIWTVHVIACECMIVCLQGRVNRARLAARANQVQDVMDCV